MVVKRAFSSAPTARKLLTPGLTWDDSAPRIENLRTPDVVEFGMSPFSWRRHSCLLGRDSGLLMSPAISVGPGRFGEPLRAATRWRAFRRWGRRCSPSLDRIRAAGPNSARMGRRHRLAPPAKLSPSKGMAQPIFPATQKLRGDIRSSEPAADFRGTCRIRGNRLLARAAQNGVAMFASVYGAATARKRAHYRILQVPLQSAAGFSPPSCQRCETCGGRTEVRGPLWGRLKPGPTPAQPNSMRSGVQRLFSALRDGGCRSRRGSR